MGNKKVSKEKKSISSSNDKIKMKDTCISYHEWVNNELALRRLTYDQIDNNDSDSLEALGLSFHDFIKKNNIKLKYF